MIGTLFDTSASALSREANLSRAKIQTKAVLRFNNHMTHNLLSSLVPQCILFFSYLFVAAMPFQQFHLLVQCVLAAPAGGGGRFTNGINAGILCRRYDTRTDTVDKCRTLWLPWGHCAAFCRIVGGWPGLARQACVHTAGQGMLCTSRKRCTSCLLDVIQAVH